MSFAGVIGEVINEKLKDLHVAFLAKILSINGNKAKIQPLGLTKQYGGVAEKQAVITGVHIAQSARYKFADDTPKPIAAGDIVLCVCCDRNIDGALKGENVLPPVGFHTKSDCVIVSII